MKDLTHRRIGHYMRWFLELIVIWDFVYDETGVWTCIALTLITIGIEFDHLDPREWWRARKDP